MIAHEISSPSYSLSPEFVVIPFPASRRVGHIRRIAKALCTSRTQKEADIQWKRAVDGMGRQMERSCVDDERIDVELAAFRKAVTAEMARHYERLVDPDGEIA